MNLLSIEAGISLWEAVATIQIAQATGHKILYSSDTDIWDLCQAADVGFATELLAASSLAYGAAYRTIDSANTSYVEVLAQLSNISGTFDKPLDIRITEPKSVEYIVVCPFTMRKELELPTVIWQAIIKILRLYEVPIYLLSGRGEWQDECGYSESEILSERDINTKLKFLSGASLVVGVPNEWLWLASAWSIKTLYFYPNDLPVNRWFWFRGEHYGRIVYQSRSLQLAVLLAGVRQMIDQLTK